MKNIEQVLKFFPLFSLVLIALGFYSLFSYYNNFEINIAEFLTPSEILLSFVPNLFIVVPFLFASIINAVQVGVIEERIGGFSEKGYRYKSFFYYLRFLLSVKRLKKIGFKGAVYALFRIFTKFSVWIFGFASYSTIKLLIDVKELGMAEFLFRTEYIQITIIWFSFFLFASINEMKKSALFRVGTLLYFFALIVVLISFDNSCRADAVLFGLGEKKAEFSYNNEQYNTDSVYTYIGMTKEYLFLYNNKKAETNVFEKGKISGLKIKKGVDPEKDFKDKLQKVQNALRKVDKYKGGGEVSKEEFDELNNAMKETDELKTIINEILKKKKNG